MAPYVTLQEDGAHPVPPPSRHDLESGAHGDGPHAAHGDEAPSPGHGHGHEEKTGPDWKGDLCQCCGEGVDVKTDFKLCLKALVCPCVYYGQSMRRALLLNGYYHCLLFLVGMDLFWFVGSVWRGVCANPNLPPPSPARPVHRDPRAPSPPPYPPPLADIAIYTACLDDANQKTGYLFITCLAFMAYAAYRRYQMRLKFGFPSGTYRIMAEDLYAWVCCTYCAICQEARTLAYNNVVDGRWHGPQVTLKGLDIAGEMERAQAAAAEGGRLRSARSYTLYAGYGGANQGGADEAMAPAGEVEGAETGVLYIDSEGDEAPHAEPHAEAAKERSAA